MLVLSPFSWKKYEIAFYIYSLDRLSSFLLVNIEFTLMVSLNQSFSLQESSRETMIHVPLRSDCQLRMQHFVIFDKWKTSSIEGGKGAEGPGPLLLTQNWKGKIKWTVKLKLLVYYFYMYHYHLSHWFSVLWFCEVFFFYIFLH